MFPCKACIAKDDEIAFLRECVKDLEEKVMAFAAQAHEQWMTSQRAKEPTPAPFYVDPLGAIQAMNTETEQDQKDKKAAAEQIQAIVGH